MAKRFLACCFPLPWFRSVKKKDAATQADGIDFYDSNATENSESANEKCPNIYSVTNPFANMFINPYSNTEGLFPNPFLGDGLMDELKNPFLEKNEKLMLMSTGQSWIPLLSSNPFFDDCFADSSTYIQNPSEDPMKNVPQSRMDSKTHCQEWVEKHREYHFKHLRSFSI
ncbi:hypothetical protein AVEN_246139-1 [Araneus ventricosus]|uniref:Uncharacterized protein n=1 Tax=Araneus ventricosus TaxID=182803 RepID=A0A4Y2PXA6_ARAVE|nr:hypothetical protein AVEN_246139-1 [Araneus ventricosus]